MINNIKKSIALAFTGRAMIGSMDFFFILLVLATVLLAGEHVMAASSASYKISSQVMDAGSASGISSTYRLLGKAREREIKTPASSSFIINEGFLKSAYFTSVIFAPIITSVNPSSSLNVESVAIEVSGANFVSGASVKLSLTGETDIAASEVVVSSSGKINCRFNLSNAKSGAWSITVTNPDGRSGTLPSAFRVNYSAPTVTSIIPDKGLNNETVNITNLAGTYFRSGATVKLSKSGETDIAAENAVVESMTRITCRFNLSGKASGMWDVVVTNDDSQSGTLSQGFKVESPDIEVTKPVTSQKNPFNPSTGPTTISYSLSKDANIDLYIFNMRGEKIWEYKAAAGSNGGRAGENQVLWDGVTAFRSFASSGVYFVNVFARTNGGMKNLSRTKIAIIK